MFALKNFCIVQPYLIQTLAVKADMERKIAVVEDEAAIRENYADMLRKQGYQVDTYENRQQALAGFSNGLPQLVVIDIGLQDEYDGGFLLCQWLRQQSQTLAIIFLTARDNDFDTVAGLRMGADDYLSKDVSLPHLSARIAALFRRIEVIEQNQQEQDKEALIQIADLAIDMNRMTCHWQDQLLDLTVTEFWMLSTLAKHPGHVKSREQLMQESKMVVDDATITSHIKRIRRKFEQLDAQFDRIETVYGMGYRWKN